MSEEPNIVVENELLRRGFTSVPNYIFGMPISSNAKLIYMALLSYAWTNGSCYPGLTKLCTDVSLSDKPVTKAIEELSNASLLEVRRRGQGKTNLYVIKDFTSVPPVPTTMPPSAPSDSESRIGESPNQESENLRIKNRRISESRIGHPPILESENLRIPNNRIEKYTDEKLQGEAHTHEKPRAHRTATVCVGSKFTLEECRRYANHLQETGQGITNPGGYATAIHRSGEADALVAEFLRPKAAPRQPDASACPDCGGTGFWYPRGVERGVSKCKHSRLTREPDRPSPQASL